MVSCDISKSRKIMTEFINFRFWFYKLWSFTLGQTVKMYKSTKKGQMKLVLTLGLSLTMYFLI